MSAETLAPVEESPGVNPPSAAPSHSWTPVDLLAFAGDPPAPPTIGGLAYPGRRHVFSGEPESLKTWTSLVLCAQEIRAGRTVVYVDFEMSAAEQLARLYDLGLADSEIASGFLYMSPEQPMTDTQVRADVAALLEARRPSLVVLDAFTGALDLHGHDPNSGVEVERFYRTVVRPLASQGAAVVLLDHLTKNKDTRGRYSIGSERKLGAADVHLGFEIVRPFGRGKAGLAKIVAHKDRPGRLPRPKAAELELTSSSKTGRIDWQIRATEDQGYGADFRPTALMERVSAYVASSPKDDPPTQNQVEANVNGQAMGKRSAIDRLVAERYLSERPGPRGARLLHHEKPYRQADDSGATA